MNQGYVLFELILGVLDPQPLKEGEMGSLEQIVVTLLSKIFIKLMMECISKETKKSVPLEWADVMCQGLLLSAEGLVLLGYNQLLTKGHCPQEKYGTECYEKVRKLKITKDKKESKNQSLFL